MKRRTFLPVLLSLASLWAGCATSTRQSTTANGRPPRLQVVVDLPASMSPIRDDEVAEAFSYRVASYLHEQGFRGRIHSVYPGEDPLPGVSTLTIHLLEWRVDRGGFVDCTFSADLMNGTQSQRLGMFHGTSFMTWPRRDWFMRAEGFEESAREAVVNLARRLEQAGLIDRPGADG